MASESTSIRKPFTDLIAGNKPVLVDFSAEWCGPCKLLKPVLQELKSRLGETITIIKIDIDQSRQIASQYNIQSVPTLILFQNGKTLWRQSGLMQSGELQRIILQFTGNK